MSTAAAWSIRGVGRDTREAAQEAARRSGMTLGEWLDDVIVERAAEQGVDPDDIDNDDRLDAIADRLSGLPRRGDDRARRRRSEADEDEAPVRRFVSREETRRADDLLEAAIARFESRVAKSEARAAKSEERTARALDSLAQWVEKSESGERGEKKASELLAERLDAIETQIVKRREAEAAAAAQAPDRVEGALSAMRQVENAARDLDKRMADLARRMEEAERNRAQARPRLDLAQAVSQIARRRQALDSSQAAPTSARTEPTKHRR